MHFSENILGSFFAYLVKQKNARVISRRFAVECVDVTNRGRGIFPYML